MRLKRTASGVDASRLFSPLRVACRYKSKGWLIVLDNFRPILRSFIFILFPLGLTPCARSVKTRHSVTLGSTAWLFQGYTVASWACAAEYKTVSVILYK